MKSKGSYISSFIVTLLLVFCLIASIGCLTVKKFGTADNLIKLTEQKNLSSVVSKELEKYFTERYADTGIPADVYMKNISDEYLKMVISEKIYYGFAVLNGENEKMHEGIPVNTALENNITGYYVNYAAETDYEIKDENDPFYKKLAKSLNEAKQVIEEYCDVYKFNALVNHGILKKVKPIYAMLPTLSIICIGASAFLALLLLVCNFKRIKDALYWLGTAFLCSGIFGLIPCIYLLSTDYFAAFSIKQAQIFTAYTTAMETFTNAFMKNSIVLIIAAVLFYIIFGICSAFGSKSEKEAVEKTDDNTGKPENNSSEKADKAEKASEKAEKADEK